LVGKYYTVTSALGGAGGYRIWETFFHETLFDLACTHVLACQYSKRGQEPTAYVHRTSGLRGLCHEGILYYIIYIKRERISLLYILYNIRVFSYIYFTYIYTYTVYVYIYLCVHLTPLSPKERGTTHIVRSFERNHRGTGLWPGSYTQEHSHRECLGYLSSGLKDFPLRGEGISL